MAIADYDAMSPAITARLARMAGLNVSITRMASIGSEIITLSKFDTIMTQNGIGRRRMEKEIGERAVT